MRYKIIFSYNGSGFNGYQIQNDARTVQGEIEKVLLKIFRYEIKIYASGRTDRGVHALNQVAIFDIENEVEETKLKKSMNALLPKDIYIKSLIRCPSDFHARFSAIGKKYVYRMAIKENDPFLNKMVYFSSKEYNLEIMQKAMDIFIGEHDFKNFCTNKESLSFIETIYSFKLTKKDDYLIFTIIGSGFKRYMVRMIIGTVLACSLNKFSLTDIIEKLESKERKNVSFKAPAAGLYLEEVYYDKESLENAQA